MLKEVAGNTFNYQPTSSSFQVLYREAGLSMNGDWLRSLEMLQKVTVHNNGKLNTSPQKAGKFLFSSIFLDGGVGVLRSMMICDNSV